MPSVAGVELGAAVAEQLERLLVVRGRLVGAADPGRLVAGPHAGGDSAASRFIASRAWRASSAAVPRAAPPSKAVT